MKKRIVRRSKRRVSSRKAVSKPGSSWFDSLRETIGRRREFVFLLLVLVVGMLVFDIIGYDYTGLVIENNAVSGAQSAGDVGVASGTQGIEGVGTALQIIPNLLYEFMKPLSYLFTGANFVNTWRLIFALILFLIISPILSRMSSLGNRNGKIIAIILALAFGALFPGTVIESLLSSTGPVIQIILLIVYGALVFYLAKWLYKKTHESDRFGRIVIAVAAIILILLIIFFGSIFGSVITEPTLKSIFSIILGVGLLAQAIIGGWAVFLSATPTSKDMERIGKRDDEVETARTFRREREERGRTTDEAQRGENRTVVLNRLNAAYGTQSGLFRNTVTVLRRRPRTEIEVRAALGNLMRSFTDEETDLNAMGARDHINENVPAGRASMVNAYDDLVNFNGRLIGILRREMNNTRITLLATDDAQSANLATILDNASKQKKALLSRLK